MFIDLQADKKNQIYRFVFSQYVIDYFDSIYYKRKKEQIKISINSFLNIFYFK